MSIPRRDQARRARWVALGIGLLSTATASANGRFPRAEHLLEDPADHRRLTVAATYGVLTSDDAGANWYYTCEQGFSLIPTPPGYLGDPELALMPDGSLLAGVQARLTISEDRACRWKSVLEIPKTLISDFAVAPSNRNIVVATTRTLLAGGAAQIQLQQSTDGGHTWKVVGTPLPVAIDYTVDVDPKDPNHIYATGITSTSVDGIGVLLSSTDLGATWASHPIPNTGSDATPFIARIHPTDGNKIFVRTNEWTDSILANDALLYTDNGGMTWTELLRPKGDHSGAKLFAFALSPDGSIALAGFGDPVESGGRDVDRSVMGVYKSTGDNYAFGATPAPMFVESVSCLEWTATGVYVCGAPDGSVSYVGFAKDVSMVSAGSLTTIMRANQIKGAPPCCGSSSCNWNEDCQRLVACTDSSVAEVDAACTFDAGSNPGRPEAGGAGGGLGGAGGSSAGTGGATAGTSGSDNGDGGNCQCDLGALRGTRPRYGYALALLALIARRMTSRSSRQRKASRL